jgi:hypothetical protein
MIEGERYVEGNRMRKKRKIGLGGFEPPTPCTPSKYAKPTALQPDFVDTN